jgi:dTDP-4-amino-4,6-dideoxygalactose transaminase
MAPIPLLEPHFGGNEALYVMDAIARNEIAQGGYIERFEREFAAYVGSRYAVACSSGTAAIHVALRLLDVGPGDEVVCPTLTFVASANPILYQGATPVFVDSERETWNIDPALLNDALEGGGIKAVIVVHLLGHPANMQPIMDVCDWHGVPVIEDTCESLGARAYGKHVGTFGKVGCFSFNGNKIITTGGGGMLVTDDEALATRARHLIRQARLPGVAYQHDEVGYNYRLSNVAAAMGVAQLEQLPGFVQKKSEIAERYSDHVNRSPRWAQPSYWLWTDVWIGSSRDRAAARLTAAGIESRPLWTPLHTLPLFAGAPYVGGTVAEDIFAEALSLPSSVTLTEEDQQRVISTLTASL